MIRVMQVLSKPGGAINEDGVMHLPHFLAVLDGATSLLPAALDGAWFTERLMEELASSAVDSLPGRVNAALERVHQAFLAESPLRTPEYYPSAAGIFVQETGPTVEIMSIGDCTGFFALDNGLTLRVRDDAVRHMDQMVLRRCVELHARTGKSIAEIVQGEEIRNLLLDNRRKMNLPNGYRILSFGMRGCSEKDVLHIPSGMIRRMALCTDGFETGQDRLLDEDVSLEELYLRIRRDEAADPELLKHPRFKNGDDASAVIAEIAPET